MINRYQFLAKHSIREFIYLSILIHLYIFYIHNYITILLLISIDETCIYLSIIYSSIYPSFIHLSIHHLFIYLSIIYSSIYLSIHHLFIYLSIIYSSIYLSYDPFVSSEDQSTCIYLSIYLFIYLSIYRDCFVMDGIKYLQYI